MQKDQINRTLNGMIGKSFEYKKEIHHILRFSFENVVKICTDKRDLTFIPEDFNPSDFIEMGESVDISKSLAPIDHNQVVLMNANSIIAKQGVDFANILKENIAEVRRNKDFVPQAEAINNSIKNLIDLAKTEVELIKATLRK